MSQPNPPATASVLDPVESAKSAFLAWLFPGLGHAYQGRYAKGAIYAICIFGLYVWGLLLGRGQIVYFEWLYPFTNMEQFRGTYLMQFWVGLPSLPALIQATLRYYGKPPILWGWMDMPPQIVLNGLQDSLGKQLEIATMYTQVAGLLNVLAIFDAAAGPHPKPAPSAAPIPVKTAAEPAQ